MDPAPPAPTRQQIMDLHKLRAAKDARKPMPATRAEATAELSRLRKDRPPERADYTIRGRAASRVRREQQKQYAEGIQQQIDETHARLRAEFYARNPHLARGA